MTYAYIQDGAISKYPVTDFDIRAKFSNTSFPRDLSTVELSTFGAAYVHPVAIPEHDRITKTVEEGTPALSDGVWVQTWAVVDRPSEDVAYSVRKKRDEALVSSDWTQLQNSPVDVASWATYRQSLRDIPSQEGFPTNVNWPTAPE